MSDPKQTKHPTDAPDKALDTLLDQYEVTAASDDLHSRIMAKAQALKETDARKASPSLIGAWKLFLQNIGGWPVLAPALSLSLCIGLFVPLSPPDAINATTQTTESSLWELALLSEENDSHE